MQMSTDAYDSRINATTHVIPPYGRVKIPGGVNSVGLIWSNAHAVQLVMDMGRPVRLNHGACMGVNGVNNYIRNPFGFEVEAQVCFGAPILMVPPCPITPEISAAHSLRMTVTGEGSTGRSGVIFMPKRGRYAFTAAGGAKRSNIYSAILPRARVNYLDGLPAGIFRVVERAYDRRGEHVENIVARSGAYTWTDMQNWRDAVGWRRGPVHMDACDTLTNGVIDEHTAAIIYNIGEEANFVAEVELIDLGDWDTQWRG